jgi:hypothetical protein
VCLLSKSLYGLKQAPRAWFQRFRGHLQQVGFTATQSDSSLFVYKHGDDMTYLHIYVDDIIMTTSTTALLQRLIDNLKRMFAMKDLGPLHFFLGIQVQRNRLGFHLHQGSYAADVLERAGMLNCKPTSTPVDTKPKASTADGHPATDAAFYRGIVRALQYLTLTCPNITYAVNQVCLHMHSACDVHWSLVKRILRYIWGSMSHGIHIHPLSSSAMVAYSDAGWVGCPYTRCSTSVYCVFLSDSLVSWSSKRQTVVSRSSAEVEYRGVANTTAECRWLRSLLRELHVEVPKATLIYCDNVSTVYLSQNLVHHQRMKHVEIDIHFVRELVAIGELHVVHVPTDLQYADIVTRDFPQRSWTSSKPVFMSATLPLRLWGVLSELCICTLYSRRECITDAPCIAPRIPMHSRIARLTMSPTHPLRQARSPWLPLTR